MYCDIPTDKKTKTKQRKTRLKTQSRYNPKAKSKSLTFKSVLMLEPWRPESIKKATHQMFYFLLSIYRAEAAVQSRS